ncbi:MAG: hypothetical protein WBX01_06460, partial [Nitrososphaeraceae archaeon]
MHNQGKNGEKSAKKAKRINKWNGTDHFVHKKIHFALLCLLISLSLTSFVSGISVYRGSIFSTETVSPINSAAAQEDEPRDEGSDNDDSGDSGDSSSGSDDSGDSGDSSSGSDDSGDSGDSSSGSDDSGDSGDSSSGSDD